MTTDAVFREASKPAEPKAETKKAPSDSKVPASPVDVEAPYTDYEIVNGKPYLVEHFNLDDHWQEPVAGYPNEISIIQDYIENEIKSGNMGNDITSAKEVLKKAEKMTNMQKETRMTIKIPIIAEYMKFLMEADKVKFNAKRYATN